MSPLFGAPCECVANMGTVSDANRRCIDVIVVAVLNPVLLLRWLLVLSLPYGVSDVEVLHTCTSVLFPIAMRMP